jgi:cyclopropane fatty-acyl-phospholipid synthase-like methyltransferase
MLARYKFVAQMLSGRPSAAEIGDGDEFAIRVVQQEIPDITLYAADFEIVENIKKRGDEDSPIKAEVHDIIAGPLQEGRDAVFSLDVIHKLTRAEEHAYLANLRGSLAPGGVLIIGAPTAESGVVDRPGESEFANLRSGRSFKVLLEKYFVKVFLFYMIDEVVHTGVHPAAQYLFAICSSPK